MSGWQGEHAQFVRLSSVEGVGGQKAAGFSKPTEKTDSSVAPSRPSAPSDVTQGGVPTDLDADVEAWEALPEFVTWSDEKKHAFIDRLIAERKALREALEDAEKLTEQAKGNLPVPMPLLDAWLDRYGDAATAKLREGTG